MDSLQNKERGWAFAFQVSYYWVYRYATYNMIDTTVTQEALTFGGAGDRRGRVWVRKRKKGKGR